MGLANIRRASDAFAIDSVPGRGTRVRFTVYLFLKGADAAETHGSRIKLEAEYGQPNLGYWDSAQDWASWKAVNLVGVTLKPAK